MHPLSLQGLYNDKHMRKFFTIPIIISLFALGFVGVTLGLQAALVTLALIVIEMTFSFDNAIINARILHTMSPFWRQMFMTLGIVIAVFGMRIIFPIVVVMLGAQLSWQAVLDLALHDPHQYAAHLHEAHPSIASFGGIFLLMLALDFFMDRSRNEHWLGKFETGLQKIGYIWMPTLMSGLTTTAIAFLPINHHPAETLRAGVVGIVLYLVIKALTALFSRNQDAKGAMLKTGTAGLVGFLYLEVLDASFSLDGVIGAFAITYNVVLIALGLGVGALWVRSFTLYMVHHRTLHRYRYLEHGAHYTIALLALFLLASLFVSLPEAIPGVAGVAIIALSIIASKRDASAEVETIY